MKDPKDKIQTVFAVIATVLLLVIIGVLFGLMISLIRGDWGPQKAEKTTTYRRLQPVTLRYPAILAESDVEATETPQNESETTVRLQAPTGESEEMVTPDEVVAETATPSPTAEPTQTPTPEPTEAPTPEPTEEPEQWFYVLATAYTDSLNDTPTGCRNDLPLTENWSIAAVLEHLPYGTLVEIEGFGIRRVEDTAGQGTISYRLRQIESGEYPGCETWIDIFMTDAEAVKAFGVRPVKLRIID